MSFHVEPKYIDLKENIQRMSAGGTARILKQWD